MVVEQFRRYASMRGNTAKNKLRELFTNWFNTLYFMAFMAMSLGAVFRFIVSLSLKLGPLFSEKNFNAHNLTPQHFEP